MLVAGHRMPFHQLDAPLSAQLPQDRTDPTTQPSVEDLPAVFRYDHDVVLAISPHTGQAPPLVQRLPPQPDGASPEGEPIRNISSSLRSANCAMALLLVGSGLTHAPIPQQQGHRYDGL